MAIDIARSQPITTATATHEYESQVWRGEWQGSGDLAVSPKAFPVPAQPCVCMLQEQNFFLEKVQPLGDIYRGTG